MSRVLSIVDRLLEDDPDFDADDYMAPQPFNREAAIFSAPGNAQDLLGYAPDDFLKAYVQGTEAEWDNLEPPDEWWPVYDDDDETWRSVCYYPVLFTEGGILYAQISEVDRDGNHEINDTVEWDTPAHEALRQEFSYVRRSKELLDYYQWVAKRGEDPCGYLNVPAGPAVTTKYIVGLKPVDGRAKFWKMRAISKEPPSPPATEDFNTLPQPVKHYLNLDANGFCQDFQTWEELLAVDGVKQKEGYVQIDFEDTYAKAYDNSAAMQKVAKKAAADEKKTLVSLKRQRNQSSVCF